MSVSLDKFQAATTRSETRFLLARADEMAAEAVLSDAVPDVKGLWEPMITEIISRRCPAASERLVSVGAVAVVVAAGGCGSGWLW